MAELQIIPARHGTATFVPAGQIIKIINSSGSQVVDTWAFALPKPEPKKDAPAQKPEKNGQQEKAGTKQNQSQPTQTKANEKKNVNLPSQEEAEKATKEAMNAGEETTATATQQKSTWGSYMPTKIWPSSFSKDGSKASGQETEQQKDSRTWASYFPSGQGFSNYIPQAASDGVSAFAASHKRDPNKTYMEQLQDLSKTPVGAAGLAAITGSGWSGSTLAGYQAWNAQNAAHVAPMEFMSMPHSRAATLHLRPRVNDTLVSNLREPILTMIEDSSSGVHDTLIAACDPARYRGLGVENWEEHGSCAENLVLALEELNKRAGLKGAKAVGADITINTVPAPLNLFMNIPWDDDGGIDFSAPKSKKDDYVRFKAERDVVVVMSACPQDILDINNREPTDAHFIVEGDEEPAPAVKRAYPLKRPPPRKLSSSHATSTVGTESGAPPVQKAPPQRRPVPQKKPNSAATATQAQTQTQAQPAQAQTQTQTQSHQAAQPTKTTQPQTPKKKPVPPAPAAQKKTEATSGGETTVTPAPVAEKKKPRKLNRAKPQAQSAS